MIKTIFLFLFISVITKSYLSAQDAKGIANLVDSQNYVFVAQTALPSGGNSRQLSPEYTLKVSKETIISDLPYFGRAYSAPIGKSEGGIKFSSKTFEYKKETRKKGGWDIQIEPNDASHVRQLSLSISENGYATLQVISSDRQPISFYGYIKASG